MLGMEAAHPEVCRFLASSLQPINRVLAPVVAAAEAAEAGKCPSPGSPSHPGTSASPEVAAEAVAAVAVAAEAATTRKPDEPLCRSSAAGRR